jgi:hypothetical protein
MDSAFYQAELLNNLRWMKTRNATLAFKQMILDEPPIIELDDYEWKRLLYIDSLQLSKLLMPEIATLANLNEYERSVYDLMGTLVDSAMIQTKILEADVPQFLMEAKNELKRLNTIKSDDEFRDSQMLQKYCSLLHPFRKRPEVAAFFQKAYNTKSLSVLLDLVDFDMRHNTPVPDSILQRIARKDEFIIPLYEVLYKNKMPQRFPEKYNTREELIKLYIKDNYRNRYDKKVVVDSVVIIHQQEDMIRHDALMVYYIKYKRSDSKQWKGVVMAFDNKNPNHLWPRRIVSTKTVVLDEHEDEMQEMTDAYKLMVELNRKKRNFGRGYTSDDDYDWY